MHSMIRAAILMATVLLCAAAGCAAAGAEQATMLASPVRYQHIERTEPRRVQLHLVTVDLTDPRVRVGAWAGGADPDGDGPWQTTLQTVRAVAKRERLEVAVNANFFATRGAANVAGRKIPYFIGNPAVAVGCLICHGKVVSRPAPGANLVVTRDGRVSVGWFERLPDDARDVVTGSGVLVAGGKNVAQSGDRAPRTAAGISADGKRLVLLVVDGRLVSHSAGMDGAELADEMIRLGCSEAINLDGGGSATMVVRDQKAGEPRVLNRPSDGHDAPIPISVERPVACVLGIRIAQEQPSATTRPGQ
jgi:hypothetical protein